MCDFKPQVQDFGKYDLTHLSPYAVSQSSQSIVEVPPIQSSGRFQSILSSSAPVVLVISLPGSSQENSIAVQIAHNLYNYHHIDTEIIYSFEAMQRATEGKLGAGNIICIGSPQSSFSRWVLSESSRKTPFEIDGNYFKLMGRRFVEDGQGMWYL